MGLVRSIGRWSLAALVVNAIVGSTIFGVPSEVIRLVGWVGPLAMILAALIMSFIVACMAEVASQFTQTGGAYLYVRTVFGRFAALQVGWFWLLASLAGAAAATNLFVQYLASLWPTAAQAFTRVVIITVLIAIPTVGNYLGVRFGTHLSNLLTVAKMLPLILLIGLGIAHVLNHPSAAATVGLGEARLSSWFKVLLLLVFAYSGFENTMAPMGEVEQPRRTAPFALFSGLAISAALYALLEYVVLSTIGARPSEHPLADSALLLVGSRGSLFVAVAAMISTYGWLSGDVLTTPRVLYAFAENGDAPRLLGKLHPRHATPYLALIAYAVLAWLLAVTGTFLWVVAVGGAAALILYCGVCAALIRLRKTNPQADALRLPFGRPTAVIAIGISAALISSLDWRQGILITFTGLFAALNWWAARRKDSSSRISATAADSND